MDLGQIDNQKEKKISESCYREIIKRLIAKVAAAMRLESVHHSSQDVKGRAITILPPTVLLLLIKAVVF